MAADRSATSSFTKIDEMIYEYGCHEGNYAMEGILSGERARERDAEKAKPPR